MSVTSLPDRDDRGPVALVPGLGWTPSLELLLASARLAADAIVVLSSDALDDGAGHQILWANPAFDRLLGLSPGQLLDTDISALRARQLPSDESSIDPDATDVVGALLAGTGGRADATLERSDGSIVMLRLTSLRVDSGEESGWLLTLREIESQVRADEQLRASEERFRALATHAPIGIFISEVGMRLGYVNERFAELWGHPVDDVLGTGWMTAVDPEDLETVVQSIAGVLAGEEMDLPIRIHLDSGELRWVRARATPVHLPGRGAGLVGSLEDITEDKRHEAELAHQATHDPLTGLPNRTLLWRQLSGVMKRRRASDPSAALLFFDLDNFKLINDALGHDAGDQLLLEVADRLTENLRAGDTVARFGGDEFVVLCPTISTEDEAVAIADRMLAALAQPATLGLHEVRVTASVGVVIADEQHSSVDDLVRDADVAMYQAKGSGKARCAVFDEKVRADVQDRLTMVTDLRAAIELDQLDVAYQPVVHLASGRPVSVEALVRWDHPTRGQVPASELIALAEETGVITSLGTWVLRRACHQLAEWRRDLGAAAPAYVAVNLSTHQLNHPELTSVVIAALADAGLQGTDLCLELTESVLMADATTALRVLETLKSLGVRLAIDDFGTGYSSLAYLKRLPVHLLKVDRSFVAELADANEDTTIVAAIVGLARALGLSVVAEGVETAEQTSLLAALGCTYGQGYHLSRPVPPAAVADYLVKSAQLAGSMAGAPVQ